MNIEEQIVALRHDECGKCEICDDMRQKAADTLERLNAVYVAATAVWKKHHHTEDLDDLFDAIAAVEPKENTDPTFMKGL